MEKIETLAQSEGLVTKYVRKAGALGAGFTLAYSLCQAEMPTAPRLEITPPSSFALAQDISAADKHRLGATYANITNNIAIARHLYLNLPPELKFGDFKPEEFERSLETVGQGWKLSSELLNLRDKGHFGVLEAIESYSELLVRHLETNLKPPTVISNQIVGSLPKKGNREVVDLKLSELVVERKLGNFFQYSAGVKALQEQNESQKATVNYKGLFIIAAGAAFFATLLAAAREIYRMHKNLTQKRTREDTTI